MLKITVSSKLFLLVFFNDFLYNFSDCLDIIFSSEIFNLFMDQCVRVESNAKSCHEYMIRCFPVKVAHARTPILEAQRFACIRVQAM